MGFETINEVANAASGTELIKARLASSIPPNLLEDVQIVASRFRGFDGSKYKVFWAHDLEVDPETYHLADGGYNMYDALVFVSNWQMQNFINKYSIPWSKCQVIHNAIDPIYPSKDNQSEEIRFIYHTTPHRGLILLLNVFTKLACEFNNITLDIYSSYKIYGDPARDELYANVFEFCRNHPKINYFGTVSNQYVRDALAHSDIYAYPCVWPETSCISLIEAMSAGLICSHPNFGALYETSGGFNKMYQWNEQQSNHENVLHKILRDLIINFDYTRSNKTNMNSKIYADLMYNMDLATNKWILFLNELKS